MEEIILYIKERFFKPKFDGAQDMKERTLVRNAISMICEKSLEKSGDLLVFEVLPKDLPYALEVIAEEPLTLKFDIYQVTETLFKASLKEAEIFDLGEELAW